MKKILTILVFVIASLTNAMATDEVTWGYYTGDLSDLLSNTGTCTFGVGSTGTFRVCMYVPGDGVLKGGKLSSVKIPIWKASVMKNVTVWATNTSDINTHIVEKKMSNMTDASYNEAVFDTPVAIPNSGLFVGFNFTISSASSEEGKYPIIFEGLSGKTYDNSFYFYYQSQWYTCANYGPLAIQVKVQGVTQPEGCAKFYPVKDITTVVNSTNDVMTRIASDGSEEVRNITYDIDVAGVKETRDMAVSIPAGYNQETQVSIPITAPAETGKYTVKMIITKVNGKQNSLSTMIAASQFNNVSRIAQRKTVMEEFTGTECQYCPRGMVGIEKVKNQFGDIFIPMAFHQYNGSSSTDAMEFDNWRDLGLYSAPSCNLDGKALGIDPYYGSNDDILEDFEYYNAMAPLASIQAKAYWMDSDMKKVNVSANVESLCDGKYTIAYALVADSLKGSSSAWAQRNYYCAIQPGQIEDDLSRYGQGGEYGTQYFYPYFNDVVIASSYNESKANLATALGTLPAGQTVENSYVLEMPAADSPVSSAALKSAQNGYVYAVILVLCEDGSVANAERVNITFPAEKRQTVTTSAKGYATFFDSRASYTLPEGMTAMVATEIDGDKITYNEVAGGSTGNNVIPVGTAVLLSSGEKAAKKYTLTLADENVSYTGVNYLYGSDVETITKAPSQSKFYKLTFSNDKSEFGWFWGAENGAAFTIPAHKAWLAIPTTYNANPRGYILDVADGITAVQTHKRNEGAAYNVAGQRVGRKYNGIVIENGKKIVK